MTFRVSNGGVCHVRKKHPPIRVTKTIEGRRTYVRTICGKWVPPYAAMEFHKLKNKSVTKCEECRGVLIGRGDAKTG